jgi:TonB family protein
MKHCSKILKLIAYVLIVVFSVAPLWGGPDVAAQLRLYEGFKEETAAPARVVTSYYLKPITDESVFSEVDITREKASLKKVFNLKDITLVTQAQMVLFEKLGATPFKLIVLNGRKLLLQMKMIEGEKNRFKVEVMEKGGKVRSLLETKILLPEKKTTVLGFEDSEGKIYFLSFHRGKDVTARKPVNIKDIERPKLLKSPPPKYPKEALKKGIDGMVAIEAVTDVYGRVAKAKVLDGPAMLREPALEAIKQWVYEPYILDGIPTPVRFTVRIKFNLHKKKSQKEPLHIAPVQRPKLVKKVEPKYPQEALDAGIEGKVVIEAVTDIKGHVVKVRVVDGPPELRAAALDALKQWQYEPYYVDGKPKPVSFTVIVKFALDPKKKAKPIKKPVVLSSQQRPKLLKCPPPKYPSKALEQRIQGNIVIEVTTDEKGRVAKARVIEGIAMLNGAALNAVKQWQYEVYYLDGEPTPVTFTVVVKFKSR